MIGSTHGRFILLFPLASKAYLKVIMNIFMLSNHFFDDTYTELAERCTISCLFFLKNLIMNVK